ncbi:hypothetical protein [Planctomyces sp. SH-PL62]|uniref:hypothetical protein n=1 Tax=Planctomyces sp. SH-PL62 TaxID=1636152 RepID=UPI00078B1DB7|nr:hypothetical protein [Planctomyces sp. SH-PL62]AMV37981.1 hypothetical protein VT85_11130 [Planctomyces sp. SH-PL62]
MKAKAASRMLLALSACLAAAGCRTAGVSPSTRPTPPAAEPRVSFYLDEFVRDHNRNARLIQTVKASPTIGVSMTPPDGGKPQVGSVSGRLAVVQPYDFKLELGSRVAGVDVADMGSNRDEFWFWVKNDDKYIFRASYDDLAASELAATYQPDWIVSALGLKPITPDEAASARIKVGPQPGTTLLRLPPSRDQGSAYIREMVVDDATNRILAFHAFDRDGKTLLGRAAIKHYAEIAVKSTVETDSETDAADRSRTAAETTCRIPDKLTLEWKRERLTLDIAMSSLKLNQPFPDAQRTALFVQPQFSGYTTMDLAEMTRTRPRGEPGGGDTTVRETLPAPEPPPRPAGPRLLHPAPTPTPARPPGTASASARRSRSTAPGSNRPTTSPNLAPAHARPRDARPPARLAGLGRPPRPPRLRRGRRRRLPEGPRIPPLPDRPRRGLPRRPPARSLSLTSPIERPHDPDWPLDPTAREGAVSKRDV